MAKQELMSVADMMKTLQQESKIQTENMDSGMGFIKTTGKRFTFPNGDSFATPFEAIIVDSIIFNQKFKGAFNPGKPSAPICWAFGDLKDRTLTHDDLIPSKNVVEEQNKDCASCPFNEWGSGQGRGKACANKYRLALLPPDFKEKSPIWYLDIPPASIRNFQQLVIDVQNQHNSTPLIAITEVSFKDDSAQPIPQFKLLRKLSDEVFKKAFMKREEATRGLLLEPVQQD